MSRFEHLRHKPPSPLSQPREVVVAIAPLRSGVNLSKIVRTAGCCGITKVFACGNVRVDRDIAREGADEVEVKIHRTLPPVLKTLKADGYVLVGLEQTTNAQSIHDFAFPRRCAIVMGNERLGLTSEELDLLDAVVEIPVWGRPFAYNVATAADMAMYEYCRQYPRG